MKILIVEDLPSKIQKIVQLFVEQCNIDRDDILIAQSATDARRILKDTAVDLLILDILLPLRPEDEPTKEASVELLGEITEEALYTKPRYIVGLTAYQDAAQEVEAIFHDHTWTIVIFDETTNNWMKPLCNCVEYISARYSIQQEKSHDKDLCIITALPHPEMTAIRRLSWEWEAVTPLDDSTFVQFGKFTSNGKSCSVVAAAPSRMGMIATGLLASKLIYNFRPRFLVMSGICAGIKEKTKPGDVIFADPTWDWQSGKRVRDKDNAKFAIAPHQLPVAEFARARAQQLAGDAALMSKIRADWVDPPSDALRFLIGPIASGSAVLADGQVVEEIRAQERNLLGVEMECYGLFAAAASCGSPRPTAMAFKAVSDYADPDKKDDKQAYAAYTSANVLMHFFEKYFHEMSALAGS